MVKNLTLKQGRLLGKYTKIEMYLKIATARKLLLRYLITC